MCHRIRKKDPRVQIDLSSIAKGFAVDKIIESLNYDNILRILARNKNSVNKSGLGFYMKWFYK